MVSQDTVFECTKMVLWKQLFSSIIPFRQYKLSYKIWLTNYILPYFMPTYFDSHQTVPIFEKRIKFTYKLQLRRLMNWASITTLNRTDAVLWDPFIIHTTNVDIRMLHGYRVLVPIRVHNRRIVNPFKSIQNADRILPVEIYI